MSVHDLCTIFKFGFAGFPTTDTCWGQRFIEADGYDAFLGPRTTGGPYGDPDYEISHEPSYNPYDSSDEESSDWDDYIEERRALIRSINNQEALVAFFVGMLGPFTTREAGAEVLVDSDPTDDLYEKLPSRIGSRRLAAIKLDIEPGSSVNGERCRHRSYSYRGRHKRVERHETKNGYFYTSA